MTPLPAPCGRLLLAATLAATISSLAIPAGAQPAASRSARTAPASASATREWRWGGDPEGGAPYVEADPTDPSKVQGFDVEVATLIARKLGLQPRFVSCQFTSIDASVRRGDFEIGLSGIEDTPARRGALSTTIPYYEFREVISVRGVDRSRYAALADFKGRRVGTLGGTIAYEILLKAQSELGITPISYDDDVHPYSDLVLGRIDGVLLDNVLANKAARRDTSVVTLPVTVAIGHYVGVLSRENVATRDRIDGFLREAMRDGTLEGIFRRWGVWNDDQPKLYARVLARAEGTPIMGRPGAEAAPDPAAPPPAGVPLQQGGIAAVLRYLPALFKSALITLVLSCLSMALAVSLGVFVASGRVYGGPLTRALFTAYVELTRGTPVLLQLFVLYYGLADYVRLPAFVAALLGLGLNYAAYESEIYRAALEAVPKGQLEAARVLGLSERQVFTLVRGPQALRLALAPMTNDFVALLKDSSLVSVLTVVELTKQTSIFAANIGSWVVPGALCAAMYLAMSLPLSRAARVMEARWKAPTP